MSGTINLALTQQFDSNGEPLSGGRLFFFAAGTSTPQNAFQDTALAIVHPNPLILDSSGRVPMFYLADGSIKVRLENDSGLTIFAADNLLVIGPSSGGGGGGGTDATTLMQTGDIKARFSTGSHTGFVRCNGNTIGNSGSSSSELADATAEQLFKYLWTTSLPMLTSGGGAAVKTTAAADWLGNNRMTLPDLRGRVIAGLDDMGAAAASRLTSTFFGSSPIVLGNGGGVQSIIQTQSQLPNVTLSSASLGASWTQSPGNSASAFSGTAKTFTISSSNAFGVPATLVGGTTANLAPGATPITYIPAGSFGQLDVYQPQGSVTITGTISVSGDVPLGGSAVPMAILPPAMVMTFYMKL